MATSVTEDMNKLNLSSKNKKNESPTKAKRMRKRLSVVGAHGHSPLFLDGTKRQELSNSIMKKTYFYYHLYCIFTKTSYSIL